MASVAIIGSFRRHYAEVLDARRAFEAAGLTITSPSGRPLLDDDEVRFEGDDPALSEAALETLTLERVMAADLVYVMAPDGYVGRATAYELGRLMQAGRPVYFSAAVLDPPIEVPSSRVISAAELAAAVVRGDISP